MSAIQKLLTDHIDLWTAAETEKKSGRGRSSGNAGSVYGIKKLRELILELAVRGKLVPQDANDEPARELLKRIQAEKANLIAAGKIKKDKPLSQITDEEEPFELPIGWEWSRLGELGTIGSSNRIHQKDWTDSGVPFYRAREIVKLSKFGYVDNELFITEELFNELTDIGIVPEPNDLMITGVGTIGVPYVVKQTDKFYFKDASVLILKNHFKLFTGYLYQFLISPYWSNKIHSESMGTTVHTLTIARAKEIPVPLPPFEEQHRIVAKVDELMELCDQLETQHSNAAEAHEKLVNHLLGTLTQSPVRGELVEPHPSTSSGQTEFEDNWQRIAAHFDTLFTTEASIDALKQTLLQLAVMGKLVPQDPNDEPASELLKRILAEKAKLVAEGKIKKDKPLPLIIEEEKLFDLPKSWEWARLGELVETSGAGWSPSCEGHPRIGNDWGVLKVSAVSWGEFLPDENKALPKTLDARPDCAVEQGDFLVSRANTAELVARSVVVEVCPPNLMLSDKIVRLRLSMSCDSRFINIANSSSFARNYYSLIAGGTSSSMKNVTREQILNLLIGMPPLAEQHRIVAKVDELMAICDQLKARITKAKQLQQKLADVLVEQAVTQ